MYLVSILSVFLILTTCSSGGGNGGTSSTKPPQTTSLVELGCVGEDDRHSCSIDIKRGMLQQRIQDADFGTEMADEDLIGISIHQPGTLTIWTEGSKSNTAINFIGTGESKSNANVTYLGVDSDGTEVNASSGTWSGVRWEGDKNGILAVELRDADIIYDIRVLAITNGSYDLKVNFLVRTSNDKDSDGFSDQTDNCDGASNPAQRDTDGDGLGNDCDEDADGDGFNNERDAFPTDATEWVDRDGDEVGDNGDNCADDSNPNQLDTDNDGLGDECDADKDGDGLFDEDEAGLCRLLADCDLDGTNDNRDNCADVFNPAQLDTDTDGFGDACDADIDGDGVGNNEDAFELDGSEQSDSDGDGIGDNSDNCVRNQNADQSDMDTDGFGDACDTDIDGDGVGNSVDAFALDGSEQSDRDGDGIGDNSDNCVRNQNADQSDSDGDRLGDACDEDIDGDGALNEEEEESCIYLKDCDGDRIADAKDNCDLIPNRDQLDTDGDKKGDVCDEDKDADGVNNEQDDFPLDETKSGMDTDEDGIDDALDNCDFIPNSNQTNMDGDEEGDICDEDKDGDGTIDLLDAFPLEADEAIDSDGDGIGNNADNCPNMHNPNSERVCAFNYDFDEDGIPNFMDVDDDNDGYVEIGTAIELDDTRFLVDGTGYYNQELPTNKSSIGCPENGCSGYELTADIDLSGGDWLPLGNPNEDGQDAWQAHFDGNDWTISNLAAADAQDDFGLFSKIADGRLIRRLRITATDINGTKNSGIIAAEANKVRIESSHIQANSLYSSGANIGGLIGKGESVTISSSSVRILNQISGSGNVGGLIGDGAKARISSSYAIIGTMIAERGDLGGLIGYGSIDAPISIISSSAQVQGMRGTNYVGGLIGYGGPAQLISSYAQINTLTKTNFDSFGYVGGLIGGSDLATTIVSSYAQISNLDVNTSIIGGLVGALEKREATESIERTTILSSYAQTGPSDEEIVGGLIGLVLGSSNLSHFNLSYSYWDGDSSNIAVGFNLGSDVSGEPQPLESEAKSTIELQGESGYSNIYAQWDDGANINAEVGIDPITIYCDSDRNGIVSSAERVDDNRIWHFSPDMRYPAIRCTPISAQSQQLWRYESAQNER